MVYVGQRLMGFDISGWHALGWLAMAGFVVAPFGVMVSGRFKHFPDVPLLSWIGFLSMGAALLLLVLVLAGDVLQLRGWLGVQDFAALIVGVTAVLFGAGLFRAARPSVVRVEVPITDLPADLEGFRIVQISDLHVGPTLKAAFVERVVATANGLAPDLVALTGDVADGFVSSLRGDVAPLARLVAPHGKFFVTGNHEYYWDAPGWVQELQRLGFRTLVNAHDVIEHRGSTIVVAGVTDHTAGAIAGHRSDAMAAVAGAPQGDVRLLLAHQPSAAYAAREAGFDLQLSGHTHGGQFFPFSVLVRLFQPFVSGLHRLEKMWIYVSRGTGYWGPPLRLGAPSEITLLQLTRA